jgi:hypothetical protein
VANERLRGCIAAAGLTFEAVAQHVKVDPKTVERWITTGRVPHRGHRWATAALLQRDETYLWPSLASSAQLQKASEAEFVQLYPNRGAVPPSMWTELVDSASDGLDILVYSGLFLVDNRPDLADILADKARSGVRIRLLFGDPESAEVARRGNEEGIGAALASRITIAVSYLSKAVGTPGLDLRLHDTILYNSIYRSDTTMLVNTHAYGTGAGFNPVIHLQRVPGGRMFDHYQASFDRVWETAKPIETTR